MIDANSQKELFGAAIDWSASLSLDSIILLRLLNNIEEVFNLEVGDDDITPERFANIKTLGAC